MVYSDGLIKRLSEIARVEIPKEDQELFINKIHNLIEWYNLIDEVDTTGVEPTFSVLESLGYYNHNIREDIVTEPNNQADIIKNAPDSEDVFIAVPKIIE